MSLVSPLFTELFAQIFLTMGPGGRPKVEHSKRQRLDLEAAVTLVIYMVEKQTKGSFSTIIFRSQKRVPYNLLTKAILHITGQHSL